jgi:hypothetical protein
VKEPNRFRSLYGAAEAARLGAIGRLSKSTSRSCSRSLSAPINLDGKNLPKLITKSIRSNKSQAGDLGILSENWESNDSVSVRPRSIAHSICTSSPTRSPNSADTRPSRFLGSGRITGKQEAIPAVLPSPHFGKFATKCSQSRFPEPARRYERGSFLLSESARPHSTLCASEVMTFLPSNLFVAHEGLPFVFQSQ